MEELFTSANIVAFLTLFALEVILGIDNVIFIAILSSKLPEDQQEQARRLGIGLAVISRILLLFAVGLVIRLEENILVTILGNSLTAKDVILIVGGLFLIGKSTYEIFEKLEGDEEGHHVGGAVATMKSVLFQVLLLDVVFSLDSVITAIGITQIIPIIVTAIIGAAIIMVLFANSISEFVERHPSMKVLALSFLIMIGVILVVEGWDHDAAKDIGLKNYVYFTMAFSFGIEMLNIRIRGAKKKKSGPVKLRKPKQPVVD